MLRYDVLAVDEAHAIVGKAAVTIGGEVAHLDERVPPVGRGEHQSAEVVKPLLLQEVPQLIVGRAILVLDVEGTGEHEAHPLPDAPGEVCVDVGITVDVVEPLAVGAVHVDGQLPCTPPLHDVALGECLCGALQLGQDALHLSAVALSG